MTRRPFFSPLSLFFLFALAINLVIWVGRLPAGVAGETPQVVYRGVSTAVQFDVSPPLRSLAPAAQPVDVGEMPILDSYLAGPLGVQDPDPLVQSQVGPNLIPQPLISFDGPDNLASAVPPDPVGDVGPDHYVAMSNLYTAIYLKDGTLVWGPFPNNTFWSGFGGDCEVENWGDPIVVHDQLANRWILTQLSASTAAPYYLCVAISTSPDPTGSYYRYAFSTDNHFPDYPKYGVWPDAYYMSANEFLDAAAFLGVGVRAFNREQMLAGNPTPQVISFFIPQDGQAVNIGNGLLPTDLDGVNLPPAGSPNYYMGSMDDGGPYGAPQDALTLWKFHVDFDTPANSTFTLANPIPVAPFDSRFPCSPTLQHCIPQPDTTNKVDMFANRQRLTWRLSYRNFDTHESLVAIQSVEAAPNMSGIRWYEIRDPNGVPTIYQQGTYAPGISDGIYRWLGSIAMDSAGNIALGYSASDASNTYPSIWYTGRLAGDPLGTMAQGEGVFINGTGSQLFSPRWGDYSSMNVDPVDDCTFWYVNEYLPVTSGRGWRLHIGAFRFPDCGEPDFTLSATPDTQSICSGSVTEYAVPLDSFMNFAAPVTLSTAGEPAGAIPLFNPNPATPPVTSTLTISEDGSSPAGVYNIDIVGMTATRTHTTTVEYVLYEHVPPAITPIAPANGAEGIAPAATFTWTQESQAADYTLTIASDPDLANVVFVTTTQENNFTLPLALAADTTYYWQVNGNNACGQGGLALVSSFTTRAFPHLLLVDDDDNLPDTYPIYEFVLNTSGVAFDVWDTDSSDNEPAASDLAPYETVIWFTGDADDADTGPGADGEAALSDSLAHNKCLLMSSQDYYHRRGLTSFMATELGVAAVTNDTGQTEATGAGVFNGLGPYMLAFNFENRSDTLNPNNTAAVGFTGNVGNAVLTKDDGYRTAYFGFPYVTVPGTSGRVATMNAFLDWCHELHVPSAGANQAGSAWAGQVISYTFTITNNGAVTDSYLFSVASEWETTQSLYESSFLPPGESSELMIGVQVPAGAQVGEMDTATLSVRSLAASSIAVMTQAVTTVIETPPPPEEDYVIFLPLVLKQPEDEFLFPKPDLVYN